MCDNGRRWIAATCTKWPLFWSLLHTNTTCKQRLLFFCPKGISYTRVFIFTVVMVWWWFVTDAKEDEDSSYFWWFDKKKRNDSSNVFAKDASTLKEGLDFFSKINSTSRGNPIKDFVFKKTLKVLILGRYITSIYK